MAKAQRPDRRIMLASTVAAVLSACTGRSTLSITQAKASEVWIFDRLSDIGGHATTAEGGPTLIDSPFGKVVQFDGVDDALFVASHPLAGAEMFTFEAVFRPDGGAFAQRWFHLQSLEAAPANGSKPLNTRIMFELRVVENSWYLDVFTTGAGYNKTLVVPQKIFPLGRWYHVAQSYDGKTYRSYVNGVLQDQADINFKPQPAGHTSIGTRINRVDYFKGCVREARFTRHALDPSQFTIPSALNPKKQA